MQQESRGRGGRERKLRTEWGCEATLGENKRKVQNSWKKSQGDEEEEGEEEEEEEEEEEGAEDSPEGNRGRKARKRAQLCL